MDLMQYVNYLLENWHYFIYAGLALNFLRGYFSKEPSEQEDESKAARETTKDGTQDGKSSGSQAGREGAQPILPVGPDHLASKKSMGIAYVYYILGGFVTGTHHIYLGHHACAICYSCSLGFLGVGSLADAVLIPYYVWRANRLMLCHPLARQDSVWTLCWTAFMTAARWLVKGGFVIFVVGVLVPMLIEFLYDADLSDGGSEFKKSPYKVLGVSRLAGTQEMKTAYKSLSKEFHPDLNPGCNECADRMGEINDAWSRLKSQGAVPGGSSGFKEERGEENDAEKPEDTWLLEWATRLDRKWQTLVRVGVRKAEAWNEWHKESKKASKRKKKAKPSPEKKAAEKKQTDFGQSKTNSGEKPSGEPQVSELFKVLKESQSQKPKAAPITIEDFAYMLKHLSKEEGEKLVDRSLADVMKEFDSNEDNKVSLKEVLPGDGSQRYLAEMFGSWKTSFDEADEDKDGYLVAEEFAEVLKNLSEEQIDELLDPIESVFKRLDTDKDNKIVLQELLQHAPSWMHSGWKDGFKAADTNKDGHLKSEELVFLLNHVGKR